MPLNLTQIKRRAREYVEREARAKVLRVSFAKRFVLFGREDVALSVEIDDAADPSWWVIGGSTPLNLYSKKSFPEVGMAFTVHTGITMQLLDRQYTSSTRAPSEIGYDALLRPASCPSATTSTPSAPRRGCRRRGPSRPSPSAAP
jgi:hypothetical protein